MRKISPHFTAFLKQQLEQQKGLLILWIPVLFALGIIFYNSIYNPKFSLTLILLLLSAVILAFLKRFSYQFLLIIALFIFLCGYSWNWIFENKISPQNEINGKVYGKVVGEISDLRNFYNPVNKRFGTSLTIQNLEIYQITKDEQEILKQEKKVKKEQIKKSKDKEKKVKKKRTKKKKSTDKNSNKPKPKISKRAEENWLNINGLQDIDLAFLDEKQKYEEVNWVRKNFHDGEKFLHPNPPNKISVISLANNQFQIGDIVSFNALLTSIKENQLPNSAFNQRISAQINRSGANGFTTSEVKILKSETSTYRQKIEKIRNQITKKILNSAKPQESSIANALITGNRSLISEENLKNITNSGLVHLLSISGLHMALAAGIFFISVRFLLLRFSYLALHYNIKKISAIFAILSCYFYLEIAGAPIPAQRSFFMVCLVFLAIFFDKKPNILRYLAFAALCCLLINPYNLYSISFQLSFAAITALIAFSHKTDFLQKIEQKSFIKKSLVYFLGIIIASILAQIATLPFLSYYFNNFAVFGILANLLAIPIVSFITMPLGFLAIFLMPFGIEQIALQPMYYSLDWIIEIARFVANLKYSYFDSINLPLLSIILATIGGLLVCFTKGRTLTIIGLVIFLSFPLPAFFTKKPQILIDGESKFFAIFDKKEGLIFSKKMSESRKLNNYLKALNQKEFKTLDNLPKEFFSKNKINCDEKKCVLGSSKYSNQKILILLKRNKINEICRNDFDLIINLTAKYLIPSCVNKEKILIDNFDLLQKGSHFLYFGEGLKIKTSSE